MKKMYWRPHRMSVRIIVVLALVSSASVLAVESWRVREKQPLYTEKYAAARTMLKAFHVIRKERLSRRIEIDEESDPAKSGIIGDLISVVTTNSGHLPAKQTSVNPNFAAIIVDMLGRIEIKEGDLVAVGLSGSFPALNIAVYSAIETLNLKPLVIASAGSSQFGSNNPKFMWPDMEKVLAEQGVFTTRSLAMTIGGIDDRGLGLSKRGVNRIKAAIERSDVPFLETEGYDDSLEKRMALYTEYASGEEIRAYINVGGGTISVGTSVGKRMFRPGLNRRMPIGSHDIESVMTRFVSQGTPVIHISSISKLATRYGLPLQPQTTPTVGEGRMFVRETYQTTLAAGALAIILLMLVAFLRLDLGYRLFPAKPRESDTAPPEPMI